MKEKVKIYEYNSFWMFTWRKFNILWENNYIENFFDRFSNINFIKICPEVETGMTIPRNPCEILNNKVIDKYKNHFTNYFEKGTHIALRKQKI